MSDTPRDPETGRFVSRSEATGEAVSDEASLELTAADQVDLTMRQTLAAILGENVAGATDDNDFDYYEVFDWDTNPGVDQFYALALRNPYAFAVTFLPASASWRDPPEIVDDADGEADDGTDFEEAVQELDDEIDLWHYCKRADKLAGIGQYGILVLEFDDVQQGDVENGDGDVNTKAFAKPVQGDDVQLTGLRPFSEKSVTNLKLGGPTSGRWGKPMWYDLNLNDEEDDEDATVSTSGPDTMRVHHSRVIHIPSDEMLDDEVRGIPRQQPVYNNLIDIERTLGSAGQLVYRAAAWGININIDKDFDLEDGGDELRKTLHRWEVGLENVLRTHGAKDVQSLGGEDIDPQPVLDPNIQAISSQPYMPPQSVLKGNETGERATTQDLKEWYGEIGQRRQVHNEPKIARPVIDRARRYGALPDPSGESYTVEWTPLHETSESDVAKIQKTRAEMLKIWTGGNPDDYLSRQEQADFIEDGTLPAEMEELPERTPLDESSEEVQAQFEQLEGGAVAELTAGAEAED